MAFKKFGVATALRAVAGDNDKIDGLQGRGYRRNEHEHEHEEEGEDEEEVGKALDKRGLPPFLL